MEAKPDISTAETGGGAREASVQFLERLATLGKLGMYLEVDLPEGCQSDPNDNGYEAEVHQRGEGLLQEDGAGGVMAIDRRAGDSGKLR